MHGNLDPTKLYTTGEEVFNAVSHGVGSLLAVVGTSVLVTLAAQRGDAGAVAVCLIYGLSLIVLYTMSTLYHAFRDERTKRFFRVLDHSTIYLLIAGSYTPFLLLLLRGSVWCAVLCCLLWALALVGIGLNAVSVDRFAKISMALYIGMGWAAVFALPQMLRALSPGGFALLVGGGLCYTGGIVFYKLQHRLRYMHGVWHLFVLAGSILHYVCILQDVLPRV